MQHNHQRLKNLIRSLSTYQSIVSQWIKSDKLIKNNRINRKRSYSSRQRIKELWKSKKMSLTLIQTQIQTLMKTISAYTKGCLLNMATSNSNILIHSSKTCSLNATVLIHGVLVNLLNLVCQVCHTNQRGQFLSIYLSLDYLHMSMSISDKLHPKTRKWVKKRV